MQNDSIVIVGAGHAGVQLAVSLREGGFKGSLMLVDGQDELPYQRPPLSKEITKGGESPLLRPARFYFDREIELLVGRTVTGIDRPTSAVALDDGTRLPYGHLVLACGARPRMLDVPGAGLHGVTTLHTCADAQRLRLLLDEADEVVVVGAGFIGLEFATVARAKGKTVSVIEVGSRIMARAVSPALSCFFAGRHAAGGVSILTGTEVAAILGKDGRVAGVGLADGRELSAQLVVMGIGVVANDALAAAAGLAVDNGVVVDAMLRTTDARISAIGDCARHPSAFIGRMVRIESLQNAVDQARCVARRLLGNEERYNVLPWFWSDQAGVRLQIAGLGAEIAGYCMRGSPETGTFSVFGLNGNGEVVVVESVNQTADHMSARRFLGGVPLTRAQAEDVNYNLRMHGT